MNNEKLQTMKAKQKIAIFAVCLNIVEKEGIKGNEKKIENLLSIGYNDTVNNSISDSTINGILKINLRNKFTYPDYESSVKHSDLYRTYIKKLLFEKKISVNCFSILYNFSMQVVNGNFKYKRKSQVMKAKSEIMYKVKAHFIGNGQIMEFWCSANMYLLDAAEENGYDWPYSSRAGASYTELAQVLSGSVDNSDQSLLDWEEINLGFILTDTSYPTSDVTIVLIPEYDIYGNGWTTETNTPITPPTTPVNTDVIGTPVIEIQEDCDTISAKNAFKISNILNSFYNDGSLGINIQSVFIAVGSLRSFATTSSYEYGSSFTFADNQYFASNYRQGSTITVSTNLSENSFYLQYNENTCLVAHTHPSSGLSSPSPSDANFLCIAYNNGASNIYCNTIFAANGSEYSVYVKDRISFSNFCNNNSNASFFERSGSYFKFGSVYQMDYQMVYNNLISQGFTQTDANSYALTYVLDKYNTGIKIAFRNKPTDEFKDQKTVKINTKFQPTKCQ